MAKTKVLKQIYNEYGFGQPNGIYSLIEENRDFRKHIEEVIKTEELNTQQHITNEINRNIENTDTRATEIKEKIDSHNDYVVNTVYPKVEEIETKVISNTSILNNIWEKVKNITHWI